MKYDSDADHDNYMAIYIYIHMMMVMMKMMKMKMIIMMMMIMMMMMMMMMMMIYEHNDKTCARDTKTFRVFQSLDCCAVANKSKICHSWEASGITGDIST